MQHCGSSLHTNHVQEPVKQRQHCGLMVKHWESLVISRESCFSLFLASIWLQAVCRFSYMHNHISKSRNDAQWDGAPATMIKWDDLLIHFRTTQGRHGRDARIRSSASWVAASARDSGGGVLGRGSSVSSADYRVTLPVDKDVSPRYFVF